MWKLSGSRLFRLAGLLALETLVDAGDGLIETFRRADVSYRAHSRAGLRETIGGKIKTVATFNFLNN
jgi:hypothetical protein